MTGVQTCALPIYLVLEHITKNKVGGKKTDVIYETFKQQSEDLRLLTYKLMLENFNKKYSKLDESQKTLLREFINNVSNTSTFPSFIKTQAQKAFTELVNETKGITDKVTKIKIAELVKLYKSGAILKETNETQVSVLMLTYELLKEIKNVKSNTTKK